jgi:hypothetical protein
VGGAVSGTEGYRFSSGRRLDKLESARLVSVVRRPGRSPVITMSDTSAPVS